MLKGSSLAPAVNKIKGVAVTAPAPAKSSSVEVSLCCQLGLGFDWWQAQAGTVILGYGADGRYVATVGGVGMSIPRQVGKTSKSRASRSG